MSLYSTIDRKLNADSWFRNLSNLAQLVWFRILTGPHVTTVAGLWAANEEGMARSFRIDLELFREAFAELSREPGRNGLARVIADWSAGVVWVPNSLSIPSNQPANLNVLTGWGSHIELVPECPLKTQALQHFRTWVEQRLNRYKSVPEWLKVGSDQVSPQDQDQEQERESACAPEDSTPPAQQPHVRRFERAFQQTVESWAGWSPVQSKRLVECGKDPELSAEKFRSHHKSKRTRSSDWEAEANTWVIGDEERSRPATRVPNPQVQEINRHGGIG